MNNRPTLDDVQQMTPDAVADLPLAQIAALQDDLADLKAKTRRIDDILTAALEDRFGARAQQQRSAESKDAGTVRLEDEDGLVVVADLPKRVEWDQVKLAEAARKIRDEWGDDPNDYLRISYGVSESAYKHWPGAVRQLVEPARTVKTGKSKFTIQQKEAA